MIEKKGIQVIHMPEILPPITLLPNDKEAFLGVKGCVFNNPFEISTHKCLPQTYNNNKALS